MSTPTHIIVGAVIAKYAISTGFLPDVSSVVYPLSIISANLPDIDSIVIHYPKDHRNYPCHYPFYWALAWMVVFFTSILTGQQQYLHMIELIGINVFLHFFLDSWNIRTGIFWLMPWKKKEFNFLKRLPYEKTLKAVLRQYLLHPYILLELGILISGSIYLFR